MFQADVIAIWETLFQKSFLVVTGWCYCLLFWFHWLMFWPMICGRCYATRADVIAHLCSICSMADVIAICCGRCCCHLFFFIILNMADVIAICVWQMLLPLGWCYCLPYLYFGWCYCHNSGRCYSHCIQMCWLMVLPSGRWNGHCRVEDGSGWCNCHWADVIALCQCLF